MKKIFIAIILICWLSAPSFGKEYKTIELGLTTTVHLVFQNEIINFDVGLGSTSEGADILASKVGDTRLKLAAGVENFAKTNLFVETDHAYYNFIVTYNPFPSQLMYFIATDDAQKIKDSNAIKTNNKPDNIHTDFVMEEKDNHSIALCGKVIKKEEKSFIYANNTLGIGFQLDNIYTNGDSLFFKFTVSNDTNVKYVLGYLGYLIKKTGTGKKAGVNVSEPITPLYTYQTFSELNSGERKNIVCIFPKFTLEVKKELIIDLWEKKGERMVELKVTPKQIVKAKRL